MLDTVIRPFTLFRRPQIPTIRMDDHPLLTHVARQFPAARRVLELSRGEKSHTIEQRLGVRNVTVVRATPDELDSGTLGRFDAVVCSEPLDDVSNPKEFLARLAKETVGLLLTARVTPALDRWKAMLAAAGFGDVVECDRDARHPDGPLVTLAARVVTYQCSAA